MTIQRRPRSPSRPDTGALARPGDVTHRITGDDNQSRCHDRARQAGRAATPGRRAAGRRFRAEGGDRYAFPAGQRACEGGTRPGAPGHVRRNRPGAPGGRPNAQPPRRFRCGPDGRDPHDQPGPEQTPGHPPRLSQPPPIGGSPPGGALRPSPVRISPVRNPAGLGTPGIGTGRRSPVGSGPLRRTVGPPGRRTPGAGALWIGPQHPEGSAFRSLGDRPDRRGTGRIRAHARRTRRAESCPGGLSKDHGG
jgi:hypothetical protein